MLKYVVACALMFTPIAAEAGLCREIGNGVCVPTNPDAHRRLLARGLIIQKTQVTRPAKPKAELRRKVVKVKPVRPRAPAPVLKVVKAPVPARPPITPAAVPPIVTPTKAEAVQPSRRVALVIGNSAYTAVKPLPNTERDADLVGTALREAGVDDVTVLYDLDRFGMVSALRTFAKKADAADWAVIYYAGHGMEIAGKNYLVPTDAVLETDRDVPNEAVSLDSLMASIDGARQLKMVLLDACRNNPFAQQMKLTVATRAVDRGLARVEPTGAALVVYAAKEGTTATDGVGANSPFAIAFASRVAQPGLEVNKIFRFVRNDVLGSTGNKQEPHVYGSLPPEDFYFVAP